MSSQECLLFELTIVEFLVAAAVFIVIEASLGHCCISGRQQFHVLGLTAERAAGYSLCDGQVSRMMAGESSNQPIYQSNQFTTPVFWAQCVPVT